MEGEGNKMIKKKNNKKGFTLAELLIVVAIIAVLVAISIPIFTSQLEKARESTDMANIRAAYAAVSTDVLTDPKTSDTANNVEYTAADDGTYTATVTATQKTAGWQSVSGENAKAKIGGQDVEASTTGWTITGTVGSGKVTIAKQ